MAAKFSGSATCNLVADPPITDPLDPLDGALTLTYTTLTAAVQAMGIVDVRADWCGTQTLHLTNSSSRTASSPRVPVLVRDVSGGFVFAPYDAKTKADFDGNPATASTIRPNQSFIDTNSVVQPGAGSSAIGADCIDDATPAGLSSTRRRWPRRSSRPTALACSVAW